LTEAKLDHQLDQQQATIQRLMYLSPALLLQEQLSALTGTHFHQFREFKNDVEAYRKQLSGYFIPKVMNRATYHSFSVADVDHIPRYQAHAYVDYAWLSLPTGVALYALLITVLLVGGYGLLQRSTR